MKFPVTRLRLIGAGSVRVLCWSLFGLAFLGILAAPLGLWCSFIERLTHLRLYWMAGLVVLAGWWAFRRRWWAMAAALGLVVWAGFGVGRYYRSVPLAPAGSGAGVRVAAWNVFAANRERERAVAWMASVDVDVLLLTEVNPGWVKTLQEVAARWPYQVCEARNGAAGIWLLSRWPLTQVAAAGIAPEETRPWIGCTVETPQGKLRVLGLHPRTPRGGSRFRERNAQLDLAADFAAAETGPVVLLGDLNCTAFSPWFARLLERGRLRDSAMGHGLTPTWSSGPWWLPIDHILTGGNLTALEWKVNGDRLGSDHFPVMARVGW